MSLSINEPVSRAICQATEFSQTSPWLIAYSGGLDSHVLLHASAKLLQQGRAPSISVIHVDHGLQAESRQWAKHCAQVAAHLHLPLEQFTVTVPQNAGESLEAAARLAATPSSRALTPALMACSTRWRRSHWRPTRVAPDRPS